MQLVHISTYFLTNSNKCPDFRGNTITCPVLFHFFLNKGPNGSDPVRNHYQVHILKAKLEFSDFFLRGQKWMSSASLLLV